MNLVELEGWINQPTSNLHRVILVFNEIIFLFKRFRSCSRISRSYTNTYKYNEYHINTPSRIQSSVLPSTANLIKHINLNNQQQFRGIHKKLTVILLSDSELGMKGAEKIVSAGYARNFLIPKKLAVYGTLENRAAIPFPTVSKDERIYTLLMSPLI